MIERTQIQAAAEQALLALFPAMEGRLHRNLMPTGFERPAAMTVLSEDAMQYRTAATVARSVTVVITLFCPVDEYHNSDMDTLSAMTDAVLEHFSAPGMTVGDRWLDIGTVQANVQLDYAEVRVPLSWDDDRKTSKDAAALVETVHLAVAVDTTMEE